MAQLRSKPQGLNPGYNDTGSAIGAALGVIKSGTKADEVALPASKASIPFGITLNPIPSKGTETVQCEGLAIATAGAAIARGAEVEATAAGKFITLTVGGRPWGQANTAAGAEDDQFELDLYGPGGAIKA